MTPNQPTTVAERPDLVMSSTTDSVEEIRAGLGMTAAPATEDTPEPEVAPEETPETPAVEAAAEEIEPPAAEDAPAAAVAVAPVPEKPAKAKKPTQKELDRVAAAARKESEAAVTRLETENRTLRELLDRGVAPAPPASAETDVTPVPDIAAAFAKKREALGASPKQEAYENFDDYLDARDKWNRKQAVLDMQETLAHQGAARQVNLDQDRAKRAVSADVEVYKLGEIETRARHADYDQVMDAAGKANVMIQPHLQAAVLKTGKAGAEIILHLARPENRPTLDRLNGLDALSATLEIGALKTTLTAAKPAPRKPVSRAPDPTGTEMGGGETFRSSREELENAPNQQVYNKIRNRQEQERRASR